MSILFIDGLSILLNYHIYNYLLYLTRNYHYDDLTYRKRYLYFHESC